VQSLTLSLPFLLLRMKPQLFTMAQVLHWWPEFLSSLKLPPPPHHIPSCRVSLLGFTSNPTEGTCSCVVSTSDSPFVEVSCRCVRTAFTSQSCWMPSQSQTYLLSSAYDCLKLSYCLCLFMDCTTFPKRVGIFVSLSPGVC
jgi:hypothetical protein